VWCRVSWHWKVNWRQFWCRWWRVPTWMDFLTMTTNRRNIKTCEWRFGLKIHQNNQFLLFWWHFIHRDLHQKKKLLLVVLVLGTTRTWTWRAKKAVVCVTELVAAFIAIHGLWTFLAHVYSLLDQPGSLSVTVALDQLIVWFYWFAWSIRADLLISAKLAVRWLLVNARLVFDWHPMIMSAFLARQVQV